MADDISELQHLSLTVTYSLEHQDEDNGSVQVFTCVVHDFYFFLSLRYLCNCCVKPPSNQVST